MCSEGYLKRESKKGEFGEGETFQHRIKACELCYSAPSVSALAASVDAPKSLNHYLL